MKKAFVLIHTELGKEDELKTALKRIEGVVGVYLVYGVYDLLVVVEAETEERLKSVVFSGIRQLDHLKSTLTLTVVS